MSENNGKPKVVRGDALAPTLTVPEDEQRFPYWVGALPNCPLECVDVGGVGFPKIVEHVTKSPHSNDTIRQPHVGQIVRLTRRKLDLLAAKLPSKVFRFIGANAVHPDDPHAASGGQVLDGTQRNKRSAMLLDVPTPAEVEERQKRGRPSRRFIPRTNDEPVADYIYCVPAPNGLRAAGENPPPPLGVTGLEYPAEDAEPEPNDSTAATGPKA